MVRGAVALSQQELRMAHQLVDAMSEPWRPADYRDTCIDRVNDLIEAKKTTDQHLNIRPGVYTLPSEGILISYHDIRRIGGKR